MTFSEAPFLDDLGHLRTKPKSVWIATSDNLKLRLALWPPAGRGTVLILAGRAEFIEQYCDVAEFLAKHDFTVAALDWRGQGLSDRLNPDRHLGHVNDFAEYQIDLRAAVEALAPLGASGPLFVLAHSMGGCIGLRALHEGLNVRASVFAAPMWGLRGLRLTGWMVPIAAGCAALLYRSARYAPGTDRRHYVQIATPQKNVLTSDADAFNRIAWQIEQWPELSIGGPSWSWLNAANSEMNALYKRTAPSHPSLVLIAENELVVDNRRIREKCSRWPTARLECVQGARHDILLEAPAMRNRSLGMILDFLAAYTLDST